MMGKSFQDTGSESSLHTSNGKSIQLKHRYEYLDSGVLRNINRSLIENDILFCLYYHGIRSSDSLVVHDSKSER
jgi:hypothetical protein